MVRIVVSCRAAENRLKSQGGSRRTSCCNAQSDRPKQYRTMRGIEIAEKFGPESFILEIGLDARDLLVSRRVTNNLADRDAVPILQTTAK
jgi:hypothetical protein